MHRSALADLYVETQYRVRVTCGGVAIIRIGEPLPSVLADTLPGADTPWAFVTAWNPRSTPTPVAVNRVQQRRLLAVLRTRSATVRAGLGVGNGGTWREPSLFVAEVDWYTLDNILQPFHQHAMVRGRGAGQAELHWLD